MMFAWAFAARTADEVARLLRSLGKHRYVREVDHRVHFAVDRALRDRPPFSRYAAEFDALSARDRELDLTSRDPRLWRQATADEIALVLEAFWGAGEGAQAAREQLVGALAAAKIPLSEHEPFNAPIEEPPHPELIQLDWELFPVDELDADRHAGAFAALEDSGDEINPSEPIHQEGPVIACSELIAGTRNGVLVSEFLVWSDGPYAYADYVLRGASKAAKLLDPPEGYRDL